MVAPDDTASDEAHNSDAISARILPGVNTRRPRGPRCPAVSGNAVDVRLEQGILAILSSDSRTGRMVAVPS